MLIKERIAGKLFSGRYFITLCAGVVFIYCSMKKIITSEAIVAVIMYVVQAYFGKKQENGKENGKETVK